VPFQVWVNEESDSMHTSRLDVQQLLFLHSAIFQFYGYLICTGFEARHQMDSIRIATRNRSQANEEIHTHTRKQSCLFCFTQHTAFFSLPSAASPFELNETKIFMQKRRSGRAKRESYNARCYEQCFHHKHCWLLLA
jgi:hypothetical protein